MGEKTRYSDAELQEFKELIIRKIEKAQKDYEMYKNSITHNDGNYVMDTSPTFKVLEEGAATLSFSTYRLHWFELKIKPMASAGKPGN